MTTATPIMTRTKGDVVQTTYELPSEQVTYTRLSGEVYRTRYVIVSHSRSPLMGTNETAVFPGTRGGEVLSYGDLFMTSPACDNVTALKAIGLTPAPAP